MCICEPAPRNFLVQQVALTNFRNMPDEPGVASCRMVSMPLGHIVYCMETVLFGQACASWKLALVGMTGPAAWKLLLFPARFL